MAIIVTITQEQIDKLIKYYDSLDRCVSLGERYEQGEQSGIMEALDTLGIEIEGINK